MSWWILAVAKGLSGPPENPKESTILICYVVQASPLTTCLPTKCLSSCPATTRIPPMKCLHAPVGPRSAANPGEGIFLCSATCTESKHQLSRGMSGLTAFSLSFLTQTLVAPLLSQQFTTSCKPGSRQRQAKLVVQGSNSSTQCSFILLCITLFCTILACPYHNHQLPTVL